MKPRVPIAISLSCAATLALLACATDNGANVYGPQFSPPGSHPDAEAGGPADDAPSGDDGEASTTPDAEAGPPACSGTGTIAVLAGGDATLSGSLSINGGAWTGGAIASGAAKSAPAIAALGGGFVAVTRGPADVLQSLAATPAWGAPSAIGAATTNAAPALAVVGTTAHVAYPSAAAASVNKFFHGANAGSGWDTAVDPVQGPAVPQSFGPSAATLAGAGADLVFAQDGDDEGLYVQSWSASWTAAAPITGAGTYKPAPPTLVAASGTFDLVLFFVEKTTRRISAAARTQATKAWSLPVVIDSLATTDEQVSVARAGAAGLVVAYRGQDGKAYAALGTLGASAIAWTAATPLVAGGVSVDSPPAVAAGVCGDDAIAVYASAGQIRATRLRGTTWSAPELVTGGSGARVAVGTR
jgi:hypothetical protein